MAEYKPRVDHNATPRPNMAAQHLRADIDSGRTGDKIPVRDPAAAPLGTDDEAAGTRPPESVAPRAAEYTAERHASPPPGHAKGHESGPARGLGVAIASMLAVILVVLAAVMIAG